MLNLGGLLAVYLLSARIAGHAYPGWTSIVVLTLALCGFIILSTGITGLYIGKVFEQSRERPIFVVDEIAEQSIHAASAARPEQVDVRRAST